ncbi:MAG: hypothetical protein ACQETD_10850 [Pseudomonadota bacterium]
MGYTHAHTHIDPKIRIMTAENLLILTPRSFTTLPADPEALRERLRADGFIGAPLDDGSYRPGEAFISLITFLGCSPVISLGEPGKTGEEFCKIALEGPHAEPRFLAGDNLKVPRCPGCGHRFEAWQALVEAWRREPEGGFDCPECGRGLSATQLRWRKCAGFGRYFIKVWGVFESEAVPSPNLLSTLERQTGDPWLHFYVRHLG